MTCNNPMKLSKNDKFDLELIDEEILGATIGIMANIILISTSLENRKIILGLESADTLQPSQLSVLSSSLTLISILILSKIAFARLKEAEVKNKTTSNKTSIIPYENISEGYTVNILGNIYKLIGAIQKSNIQAQK